MTLPDRCRSSKCQARLAWVLTRSGKVMPLNADEATGEPAVDPAGNVEMTGDYATDRDGITRPVVTVHARGEQMPLPGVDPVARYMPHHATCRDVDSFRRRRR